MAAVREEPASSRGLVRRVALLFRPYRRRVALVCVAILVSAALGVVNPLLTKVVFDQALFPSSGQTYLTSVLGQGVMQDLRNRLYAHLQAMSLRFFTSTRTGEIQSRLQNDVAGIQTVVTDTASSILANIVIV